MANKWNYDESSGHGPSSWPKFCPDGNGKRQSPIDIVTDKVKYDAALKPVTVSYPAFHKASLTNTGQSVLFTSAEEELDKSELQGGPLSDKYKLAQFHFHWGSTDGTGSEHRINGKMYNAELHLVHYNTKYENIGKALAYPDGLCVLGIFLEVDASAKDHEGLKDVTDLLSNLKEKDMKMNMAKPFNPSKLLPICSECILVQSVTKQETTGIAKYWTYLGSLTTPPLNECVTWVLFKDPIKISPAQLEAFRGMMNTDKKPMAGNYRAPCPMHGRVVSASFQ